MTVDLPRVTYSNVRADFSGVHALIDERLPAFRRDMLGRAWPNRIGGADDESGQRYDVPCPIDRRVLLGQFNSAGSEAIARAVSAARSAYALWSRTPWTERVAFARRLAQQLDERKFDLAFACLLEVGKSRMEAMGEAEETVDLVRYYADEMERNGGFAMPLARAFPQEETGDCLRPLGVFAVIAPFNFPLALSAGMMSGALIAGNAVVYKPSPLAGLTGVLLMQAVEAAGAPPGLVNLVCGDGATGEALARHHLVDGIVFTGSHRVGMEILRHAANGPYNKPVIAEMGGKNPIYVTARADLDRAVEGVMRSAFGLQGQKCSSGSKVYVERTVKDEFIRKLLDRTSALKIGDPAEREVFMGPVIDGRALARFKQASDEARRDGTILAGGEILSGGIFDHGAYVAPTIVDALPPAHRLNKDELFCRSFRCRPSPILRRRSTMGTTSLTA